MGEYDGSRDDNRSDRFGYQTYQNPNPNQIGFYISSPNPNPRLSDLVRIYPKPGFQKVNSTISILPLIFLYLNFI